MPESVAQRCTGRWHAQRAVPRQGDPLIVYLHPDMERLREMIQLLVAHGADLSVRKKDCKTLLDRASARGLNDFADALRDHGVRTAAEPTTAG